MKIDTDATRTTIRELVRWRKTIPTGEQSLFLNFFDAILKIFGVISCNSDSRDINDPVTSFCAMTRELHNIAMTDSFYGLRDQESLEQAVLELLQLRGDVTEQMELLRMIDTNQHSEALEAANIRIAALEKQLLEPNQRCEQLTEHQGKEADLTKTAQDYRILVAACAPLANLQTLLGQIVPLLPAQVAVNTAESTSVQAENISTQTVEKVTNAIERWIQWLSTIDELTNVLQEQLEACESRLREIKEGEKFADKRREDEKSKMECAAQAISLQQRKLAGLSRLGHAKLLKLRQLDSSLKLLEVGLDEDMLIPSELPAQVEVLQDSEVISETPTIIPDPPSDHDAAASVAYCRAMAEKFQIPTEVLLLVSLYELIPRANTGATQKKGTNRVVRSAITLGMVERFGITARSQFFHDWKAQKSGPSDQWLKFCGTCAGRDGTQKYFMFRRNEDALPWDPKGLFSPQEIVAFQSLVMETAVYTNNRPKK